MLIANKLCAHAWWDIWQCNASHTPAQQTAMPASQFHPALKASWMPRKPLISHQSGWEHKKCQAKGQVHRPKFWWINTHQTIFVCYIVLFPSINPSYFGVNTRGTGELSHPHLNKLQEMLKTGPGIISAKEIPARKIVGEIHCGVRKVMSIGRTTGPPPHTNIPGSCQSQINGCVWIWGMPPNLMVDHAWSWWIFIAQKKSATLRGHPADPIFRRTQINSTCLQSGMAWSIHDQMCLSKRWMQQLPHTLQQRPPWTKSQEHRNSHQVEKIWTLQHRKCWLAGIWIAETSVKSQQENTNR